MTGRIALPISIAAVLLALAARMPHATAQAVGPDEAHGIPARLAPHIVLSPAQKRAVYTAVSRQRLRSSAADIPLSVGAALVGAIDIARCGAERRLVRPVPQIRHGG